MSKEALSLEQTLRLALRAMVVNNQAWKYLADSGDARNFDAEEQGYYQLNEQAITAVEAALLSRSDGEAKDEPVAWVNIDDLYDLEAGEDGDVPYVVRGNEQPKNMPKSIPLYTTPPQRKPLTDEPVAWFCKERNLVEIDCPAEDDFRSTLGWEPLYTTPPLVAEPHKRTWVGLTIDEREQIQQECFGKVPHHVAFAHAIEAKLKEKNT